MPWLGAPLVARRCSRLTAVPFPRAVDQREELSTLVEEPDNAEDASHSAQPTSLDAVFANVDLTGLEVQPARPASEPKTAVLASTAGPGANGSVDNDASKAGAEVAAAPKRYSTRSKKAAVAAKLRSEDANGKENEVAV